MSETDRDELQAVDIPIVRCPTCSTPYVLRVPLFIASQREPEWIYQKDCKHKVESQHVDIEDMEFARMNVARVAPASFNAPQEPQND